MIWNSSGRSLQEVNVDPRLHGKKKGLGESSERNCIGMRSFTAIVIVILRVAGALVGDLFECELI